MKPTSNIFRALALVAAAGWVLAGAVAAEPQGRSAGQGRAGGQGRAASVEQGGPGRQGAGMGSGTRDRAHDSIHISEQQRDRFEDGSGAAAQLRDRARDMARDASGGGFDATELRRQRDQLREQIHTLLRHHDEMMKGFGDADRTRLQDHIHRLGRTGERMETCLGNLDRMLAPGTVDGARVSREARELERAARQWHKQHRKLGDELGLG